MNGIKAFDDGSGTIIEDDAITIATVNATDINCENFSSTVNFSNTGTFFTNSFNAGYLEVENNIACENITARTAMYTNTIEPTIDNIDINLFTTTTGTVKIGTAKKISLGTIIADDSLVITNGNIGTLKTAIIQPPSLISQIEFYKDTTLPLYFAKFKFLGQTIEPTVPATTTSLLTTSTATINIGGTGKIKIGDSIVIQSKAFTSLLASDAITLFNNITSGTLDIGDGITTGIMNIATSLGSTGTVNMCSNLIFKNGSIASTGATNTISLFNNITTGIVQMCTNLVFQQNAIRTSGASDTIDLFKNINTGIINLGALISTGVINIGNLTVTSGNGGTVNIGTGTRSNTIIGNAVNNSTATNNGCCKINKLQVGTGTGFRCVIIERNIGGNSSANAVEHTIPGAPTTFGNPIIFATIDVISTNIYSVMITVSAVNKFSYIKKYTDGRNGVNQATVESFNYMAVWL